MILSVALIGIGNIGYTYDMSVDKKSALSHAKAIYLHDDFELKYIVDMQDSYKDKIIDMFPKANFYNNWKDILDKNIDILVIALPTHLHYSCLNDFKKKDIKYFIVEKPLFDNSENIDLPKEIEDKIIVNYFRRFEPLLIDIKNNISKGIYGKPIKVLNKYAKGLKHNGSHNIDLMNYFFKDLQIQNVKILDKINDYSSEDNTYDLFIKVESQENEFSIFFIGGDETKYSIFEIELIFENTRIKIDDFGRLLNISYVINDPDYDGYKMLDNKNNSIETNYKFSMLNLYNYIAQMHQDNLKNISSFNDENKTSSFLNEIYKEIKCQY
ncbi:Gfo/Idh/MocA family protein [Sulfurimonas sp.]|uniref:Gfo/Idh/MocA family protein n=1 Tax=Sulfurimonas sp. TaxID=2022749 RepID=UPI002AB0FE93|nr:Gfo/Idh/MocA family oxidoreductase [Sulfurimonas sp.]